VLGASSQGASGVSGSAADGGDPTTITTVARAATQPVALLLALAFVAGFTLVWGLQRRRSGHAV
jgi:hypothetical protein